MSQQQAPVIHFERLDTQIQAAINQIPDGDSYFIALSGGLDSMALLHFVLPYLTARAKKIEVIHVHHGLSEHADAWAEVCLKACAQLNVICHVERVHVLEKGKGLEAAARDARYAVFERYLEKGGVLLQGHHLNDQAETILMKLLKGAGPEGLSGIPQQRPLAGGCLFRPWLTLARSILDLEVKNTAIKWVEDDSNTDIRFDRNYLRHEVLPVLERRWKGSMNEIARSGAKAKDAYQFQLSWCRSVIDDVMSSVYLHESALSIEVLSGFEGAQQALLVRYWLDQFNVEQPSEKIFLRLWAEVLLATQDAQPEIRWGDVRIRRFDGCLFLVKGDHSVEPFSYTTQIECLPQTYSLPDGKLTLSLLSEECRDNKESVIDQDDFTIAYIKLPDDSQDITIKSRGAGAAICLDGQNSSSVKKLFQTKKVLPWKRSAMPLLYYAQELVFMPVSAYSNNSDIVARACRLDSQMGERLDGQQGVLKVRYQRNT